MERGSSCSREPCHILSHSRWRDTGKQITKQGLYLFDIQAKEGNLTLHDNIFMSRVTINSRWVWEYSFGLSPGDSFFQHIPLIPVTDWASIYIIPGIVLTVICSFSSSKPDYVGILSPVVLVRNLRLRKVMWHVQGYRAGKQEPRSDWHQSPCSFDNNTLPLAGVQLIMPPSKWFQLYKVKD